MKKRILKFLIIFMIFFAGAGSILFLDEMCRETTGEGGNLVLDIDKLKFFH